VASASELASEPYFVDFLRDAPEMTGTLTVQYRHTQRSNLLGHLNTLKSVTRVSKRNRLSGVLLGPMLLMMNARHLLRSRCIHCQCQAGVVLAFLYPAVQKGSATMCPPYISYYKFKVAHNFP